MNWTEGSLARHSRGRKGKETLDRQRRHFAKARSSLLNNSVKKSSPSISFLEHMPSTHSHHSSISSHVGDPSSPAAQTLKRRRTVASHGDGPSSLSHYFQSSGSKPETGGTRNVEALNEEALVAKRQKLLLENDWVGISMQKPILVDFPTLRNSSNTGKWSRITTSQYPPRRRIRSFHGAKHDDIRRSFEGRHISPLRHEDVRIRVGSRELRLGGSSVTASSRKLPPLQERERAVPNVSQSSRFVSSSSVVGPSRHQQRHGSLDISPDNARKSGSMRNVGSSQESLDSNMMHVLTSSPPILQPVPRRGIQTTLLCSSPVLSNETNSVLARVGEPKPSLTASQLAENDYWKTMVGQPESSTESTFSGLPPILRDMERDITPGVSEGGHRAKLALLSAQKESIADDSTGYAISSTDPQGATSTSRSRHASCADIGTASDDEVLLVDSGHDSCIEMTRASALPPGILDSASSENNSLDKDLPVLTAAPTEGVISVTQPGLITQSDAMHHQERQIMTNVELAAPAVTGAQVSRNKEISKPVIPPPEDENDVWKRFVFSSCDDEVKDAVFEEARREAARSLKPSDAATIGDGGSRADWGMDFHSDRPGGLTSRTIPPEEASAPETSESHRATLGSSSIHSRLDLASETIAARTAMPNSDFETSSLSHVATKGTPSLPCRTEPSAATASSEVSLPLMLTPPAISGRRRQIVPSQPVAEVQHPPPVRPCEPPMASSDAASLAVESPQSLLSGAEGPHEKESFRFAAPKLFIGKLSETTPAEQPARRALPPPRKTGRAGNKAGRGRRAKRKNQDGRADIRSVPDFSGDPIEEFSEDLDSVRAHKSSLFGPLETE